MTGRTLVSRLLGVMVLLGATAYVIDWLLNRQSAFWRKLEQFWFGDDPSGR